MTNYYDIKPYSEIASLEEQPTNATYSVARVAPLVGMSDSFIRRVVGKAKELSERDIIRMLFRRPLFQEARFSPICESKKQSLPSSHFK